MTRLLPLAAGLALALALPLAAQTTDHSGHGMSHGSDHSAHGARDDSPSTKAYQEANARMHSGMDIPFTGDADIDFIRGMIAHHQGAIDMARVVLDHGSDAEVKKLAEDIIAAQEGEIAWMQDWLARNGN